MMPSNEANNDIQQTPESSSNPPLYESSLLLLGSYIIALLLTSAVHEMGHALALASISINFQLVLNPFSTSMALPLSPVPLDSLLFVTAAGTGLELLFGTLVIAVLWHRRSPKLVPLLMCAPLAFLSSSGYFLSGTSVPDGDVALMILMGVPAFLIQLLGILLLIPGAILFILLFPLLGISPQRSFRSVLSILFVGMTLHGFGMIAFALAFNPSELYLGIANVVSMTISVIILAGVYVRRNHFFDRISKTSIAESERTALFSSIALALILITIELLFFN